MGSSNQPIRDQLSLGPLQNPVPVQGSAQLRLGALLNPAPIRDQLRLGALQNPVPVPGSAQCRSATGRHF
ncbi:unnamed protein product [Boreogadus saida]